MLAELLSADCCANFLANEWKTCLCRQGAGFSFSSMGRTPSLYGRKGTVNLNQLYESLWIDVVVQHLGRLGLRT
jgi:hypothetical protein